MQACAIQEADSPETLRLEIQTSSPHRILVVDDDDDIRSLNTEVLINYGYDVDAAEDGELAWTALTTQDYDLMITDNNMPKVTGVQLLKKMHRARMTLPVIMATGIEPRSELAQNPLIIPAAMLLKPYTVTELLDTVRLVLNATANPIEFIMPPLYVHSPPLANRLEL